MSSKKRLQLTVESDFITKASELAAKRRRSISGLFEDLIEAEAIREAIRAAEEAASPYEKRVMYETLSPKQIAQQTKSPVKYSGRKKAQPKKQP